MTTPTSLHSLDDALALTSSAPGLYTGRTTPAYWNMVGPFGGVTAATMLNAVMQHPERLGEPIALTVNYAGAVGEGAFQVQATPARTNRSTQHWTITITQADATGAEVVTTTATAVTAARRETWSQTDSPMPTVAAPDQTELVGARGVPEWFKQYEMRPVTGSIPSAWDGSGHASLSQVWVKDTPARPLDLCALAAMSDVFFPRVWLRRATHVPAGTVSMTVYFHTDSQQLATLANDKGNGYVLAQAQAQEFRNGFFDQTAQLWSESGVMLTTSHQIVYFKE